LSDFQDGALCELICAHSIRAAGNSAREALRLARLAVLASESVPAARSGGPHLVRYCRAHLANALRVSGRPAAADRELARAIAQRQTGDESHPKLLNEALILSLEASLHRDQGRFTEALTLLDHAMAIDRWAMMVDLMVTKSIVLRSAGRVAESI